MINCAKNLINNSMALKTVYARRLLSSGVFQLDNVNENYAILKLNKPPVNSLNLEAVNELNSKLDELEANVALKGVILTSVLTILTKIASPFSWTLSFNEIKSISNVFTGGLDILEMYECEANRLGKLWTGVQDLWIKLYGSKKIYIAAINVLLVFKLKEII